MEWQRRGAILGLTLELLFWTGIIVAIALILTQLDSAAQYYDAIDRGISTLFARG